MRLIAPCRAMAVTLSLVSFSAAAAADSALWVRQIESTGGDTMRGIVRAADAGVFMTGTFNGTIDVDPDAGVFNLTAQGTSDAYITRYDRDGRLFSAFQLGGAGASIYSTGIATAPGDVLYVAGGFDGTIDFDPGPGVSSLTSSASGDFYVVKLNTAGQLLWARQIACSVGGGGVEAIAADAAGVHFSGTMVGATCDFDPGPGTEDRTANVGLEDFYVATLDAAGNFGWAGTFGSTATDIPFSMATDGSGNVYTVGRVRGECDYDPGPGTDLQTGSFFVLKQSPDGTELWARALGPIAGAFAFGVTTDAGGVYVSGRYGGTMDFDPGPGTANRTAAGTADAFALKLDSTGAFAWVATIGGTSTDLARQMAVAPDGRVRVGGQFAGTVDFDPGAGISNRTSAGSSDVFLLTLDAAGQFLGAIAFGGLQADTVTDMVTDPSGNLIAYGNFSSTVDFDPGTGSLPLNPAGGVDDFVWKYGTSELHLQGTGLSFSPAASSFDVIRGPLSDLRATGTYTQASCLGVFDSSPVIDNTLPPAGEGHYYLARGRSCCASEGYGDSTLTPDPRDALDAGGLCP